MENKMATKNYFPPHPGGGPHSKNDGLSLTNRPSGAVGAEGAGTGLSVGGNRGRGAPDRAGPPPPMRGRLCRAVWGEGAPK